MDDEKDDVLDYGSRFKPDHKLGSGLSGPPGNGREIKKEGSEQEYDKTEVIEPPAEVLAERDQLQKEINSEKKPHLSSVKEETRMVTAYDRLGTVMNEMAVGNLPHVKGEKQTKYCLDQLAHVSQHYVKLCETIQSLQMERDLVIQGMKHIAPTKHPIAGWARIALDKLGVTWKDRTVHEKVWGIQEFMRYAKELLIHYRKQCTHPGFYLGMWSWRVGSIDPSRICTECHFTLPGITEEERQIVFKKNKMSANGISAGTFTTTKETK